MLPIDLDNLKPEDIEHIFETHRESNTIEYKRELQIYSERETKEFLADVSSFANANGGTIFYGIDEVDGLVGLEISELDSFRLRVQQKIEDGILPRPGFKIKSLEISVNKYIFIIQIHKSFSGPHAVKSSDQYYYRSDAGKRRMDHFQLKNAFLQSNSLKEEIEKFCNKKVSEILLKETPVQLSDEAVVAMFLIPINSWNDEIIVEPRKLRDSSSGFQIMDAGGGQFERNFDGFISGAHNKGYLQLFRNGTILSVSSSITTYEISLKKHIPTTLLQGEIHLALQRGLHLYKTFEIGPPFLGILFLIGAQNHFPPPEVIPTFRGKAIGKEVVRFPEIYVTDYPEAFVLYTRKWFDYLWQGFGLDKCPDISDEGKLKGGQLGDLI